MEEAHTEYGNRTDAVTADDDTEAITAADGAGIANYGNRDGVIARRPHQDSAPTLDRA